MYRVADSGLDSILQRVCLSLFLIVVVFSSNAQELFNNLEDSVYSNHWIGLQTIDSGFARSGKYYSVVDSLQPYGLGLESRFPEASRGKNVLLKISGWVTSETAFDEAVFVVSLTEGDEDLLWKGIDLGPLITESNRWFSFSDSVKIPASVSETATIKAFLWNSDGKDRMGIDDLKFEFVPTQNPSFFPLIAEGKYSVSLPDTPIFSSNFYKIYYQKKDKSVRIVGRDGSPIVKNIWYFSGQIRGKKRKKKQSALRFKELEILEDRTDLLFKGPGVEVVFVCREYSPEIQIRVVSGHKRKQEFSRQALLLKSGQEVSEVYRKNRKADVENFQEEYWLDKEGVKFGSVENSWIVYHTPNISSLQLKPADSLLAVNLDYEKDHPFFRFPLAPDSTGWKLEQSFSAYKKGDKREYSFSVFTGSRARNLPRLMKNPHGYLATYIWTEHADFSDIRTNRAVYFGSEKISSADSATGGFVKYNIPVTKSVFYDNPGSVTNTDASGGRFSSLECAIKTDAVFSSFLDKISEKGSEICLHTPEHFTTTRERLEEALKYMQGKYGSPTWIDHGNNNGLQNNREDLICDGTLPGSVWYAMDLWKKYGVKFLHNAYYEENFTFGDWGFSSSIEKPTGGWGDFFPKPDYWQHVSRTGELYHWPTASALFVENDGLWDYYFGPAKFDDFINNWPVEINHCYPAWVDPAKGFWVWDNDSTIVAAPGFNRTLQRMAALRDEGLLNLTTIRDFLDYRLAVEQLGYEILPDGSIRVSNPSGSAIKGLSFATRSMFLLVDGERPPQIVVGDDVVFWFDLGAGESKLIRVFE